MDSKTKNKMIIASAIGAIVLAVPTCWSWAHVMVDISGTPERITAIAIRQDTLERQAAKDRSELQVQNAALQQQVKDISESVARIEAALHIHPPKDSQ